MQKPKTYCKGIKVKNQSLYISTNKSHLQPLLSSFSFLFLTELNVLVAEF